jgi:hypothetical protein
MLPFNLLSYLFISLLPGFIYKTTNSAAPTMDGHLDTKNHSEARMKEDRAGTGMSFFAFLNLAFS